MNNDFGRVKKNNNLAQKKNQYVILEKDNLRIFSLNMISINNLIIATYKKEKVCNFVSCQITKPQNKICKMMITNYFRNLINNKN